MSFFLEGVAVAAADAERSISQRQADEYDALLRANVDTARGRIASEQFADGADVEARFAARRTCAAGRHPVALRPGAHRKPAYQRVSRIDTCGFAGPEFAPMTRPLLFLLKPSFADPDAGPGTYFCPHCATIEGLLSFHPVLRERLDVRYVDFARPRRDVIAELGEAHQACPVLVLPPGVQGPVPGQAAGGRIFYVGSSEIAGFLAAWAAIGLPHP